MTGEQPAEGPGGVSRRSMLGVAGVGAAAAAIGASGGFAAGRVTASPLQQREYDFFGVHQSGILTPQQDHLQTAAFDLRGSRDDVVALLRAWTQAAATLMAGREIGDGAAGSEAAAPDDTGEAQGLSASGLTLTFGFGASLFDSRFGLASRRPEALIDLPSFAGDELDPATSDGDIVVQACADDPQVAVHAIRNLARIGAGTATMRWTQQGFGRTSATTREQQTKRNLQGFKDGTRNLKAEDTALVDRWLWADASDGAAWMAEGTYLVSRRIRILTDSWDSTSLGEQERMVGRFKASGAPLSGGEEFTEPDFAATDDGGQRLIPRDSHIALSHPNANGGAVMLRRGYNFTDGVDDQGSLDAGLFFLAFVRHPRTQFVPIQDALSRADRMTLDFFRTTGSGVYAVPPGVAPGASLGPGGAFIGQALFA